MSGKPFPVMHGSMWKEPQSLEECNRTRCHQCAYYDADVIAKWKGEQPSCEHREALIYAELVR